MKAAGKALRETAEGLRLRLRVLPGASRDAIDGLAVMADGREVIKMRVSAPPEDGKANAALVRMLAKAWKLPKSRLRIVGGETGRLKDLLIAGDARRLRRELGAYLDGD